MLNYKTIFGDILIFKGVNNCVTISRGPLGIISIDSVEIDGIQINDIEYQDIFTKNEILYFIENYSELVGNKY